jgi:hypothetical protein
MNAWLREAAVVGGRGAAGYAGVFATVLLVRAGEGRFDGWGFLPEFVLYTLLVIAVALGGAYPAERLGADWAVAVLGSLGCHCVWFMLVYAASTYTTITERNALVLTLAAAFGVLVFLSEQPEVDARGLLLTGTLGCLLAALVLVPLLPGYLMAALAWAVMPAAGSLILQHSALSYGAE